MLSIYISKSLRVLYYFLKGKANFGYNPVFEKKTIFIKYSPWLRDHYVCIRNGTIPRERALVNAVNKFCPTWENLTIHESSPGGESSNYIASKAKNYIGSQYFPNVTSGQYVNNFRCENLEKMSFEDNSIDLMITQDVFEHVMHPEKAFAEIARILKPGGMHIFTMPWYPALQKTRQRAKVNALGKIEYLEVPIYHGNPVDEKGSLVTFDWGLDFTDFIYTNSGLTTTIYLEKNSKLGLDADFLEVFISKKSF